MKEDLAKELREVRQFNDNYQKEKEEDAEKVNELQEKLRKPPINRGPHQTINTQK